MKGGWLRQDGQQTKPESAVFLAANQSPVLWRVAHKKQSGKRVTRYFPVCRGVSREKHQRHSWRQQECWWAFKHYRLTKQTLWSAIHSWTCEHACLERRGPGQSLSLCVIWGCPEKFYFEIFVHCNRNVNNFVGIFSVHSAIHGIMSW